ncbi:hypothetical protein ACFV3R_25265 [Streptomyces sp. NPDC059740]|uniref:hypothetical protein n=1 Tax=Streptomyces sp. NPDC059740 TaxID=3346926 RepID=UPI00365E5DE4
MTTKKKTAKGPYFDLTPDNVDAFLAAARGQETPGTAKKKTVKEKAKDNKARLAVTAGIASLGTTGDLLSAAPDGWKTALAMGLAGTAAAGAWAHLPGLVRWRGQWLPARILPSLTEQRMGLSMPLTGGALLTTMAATGGPEWGENPWWGFSLVWSAVYGTWVWRRWGRRPAAATAPKLTQQMLDWEQYAAAADGPYPKSKLLSPIATPDGGWSGEIQAPRGKSFKIASMDDVLSSIGVEDPDLVALEKIGPRTGRITVFTVNPLKEGSLFGDEHVVNVETGLAPIGVYYDGAPSHYRFWLPGSGAVHDFITGTSGSGKSRTVDALLAIERRSPLICSIVIDPQEGLSLPDWPDAVAAFAPGNALGIVALRAAHAIMKERGKRYNRLKWIDDKGRERIGRAFFVPGDPDPLLCLTIEEAHDILNDEEHGEEAVKLIADMAKEARKVGIKIRVCNQSPNADELGGKTLIRDILQGGNNLVLRSGSSATGKRAAGTALGDIDPGAIPREFADGTSTGGLGYLAGPDNRSAMWRAPYVEDAFGLAHEGETTPIEPASIDALPIVRHLLDEHALMLQCRNDGVEYVYDPARFTEAEAPAQAKVPMQKTAPVPATPGAPKGTAGRIVEYLLRHGKPTAPALIAKALGLPGPQVRTALKRMKDDPATPVISLGHGTWVHTAHADNYATAA